MKISILSGKGGTGKTTVATNLAKILGYSYVDCDVEEPNGFIFLKPDKIKSEDVMVFLPSIDYNKCNLCGNCIKACKFNVLANTGKEVIVFEKLCHSCGACRLICTQNAIEEKPRAIGKIDIGNHGDMTCIRGVLNVGEPMGGPIITEVKKRIDSENAILDCAPGSSCNVVKALKGSDCALLVTEATKFGLHDLKIAVELVKKMGIPFGVIINRGDEFSKLIESYCQESGIMIIGNIPFDMEIAKLYSRGELLIDAEGYREIFTEIAQNIEEVILCS